MDRSFKAAAIQFAWRGDREATLAKALELADLAAEKGAKLVAFPELCTTPFFPARMAAAAFGLAEPVPGPSTDLFCGFAARKQVAVVLPLFERAGRGRFFNSAAVIDADGSLLGVTRKAHIPHLEGWNEKFYFLPGDAGFPVFTTRVGKVGVLLSWDAFFPEAARILALGGAELLVVPTANAFASQDRWEKVLAGSAIANAAFVLRVNRVGTEERQAFYGSSFCLNPHGEALHRPTGPREAVYLASVNPDEVERTRREWSFFRDRRDGEYGGLAARLPGADALGLPAVKYGGTDLP
jgi:N-carbamoylputrescine amidase